MFDRFRYILLVNLLLLSGIKIAAQIAMPDQVCIGSVKHYYVDPNPVPGSTYTWRINGVVQVSVTNEIYITWNTPGTFELDVQEKSADGCPGPLRSGQVFVISVPGSPGPVTGPSTFIPGTTGVTYSVGDIPGATNYNWSYTGTGVVINGSGKNVTLDFSSNATGGQLKVAGENACGTGPAALLDLTEETKTLNLKVYLEGFNNGTGGQVKVQGCIDGENSFDMFSGTISDTLTVQLAQTTEPYLTKYTLHGVSLNTDGTITLNSVPASLTDSYYIIIKHRNHIETWSQIVPFSGSVINYNFTDAVTKAWGNNLVHIGSYYFIYSGDSNGDQYVDGFDLALTFNLNKQGKFGYQVSDVNGDGFVDGFDLAKVFNNNKKGVGMNTPLVPYK
jgi:hypothetical protein